MARTLAFAAMLTALLMHVACTLHIVDVAESVTDALYTAIEWGAVALVAARVIAVRRNRAGWALIGLGVAMWSAGDVCWTLWLNALETAPYPNVSDVFYLGMYVCMYAGLALLLRDRIRPFPMWLTLDGALAGLTLGALAAGTVFIPVKAATHGDAAVVAATLAYLVCDLLLFVMVLVAFAATAWRPGRAWWLLGGGLIVCALADTLFVVQESRGAYVAGTYIDNLWPAALVAIAFAAWQRTEQPTRPTVSWAVASVPMGGSVASIAMLIHAGLSHVGALTVLLAGGALLTAVARSGLMLAENFALLGSARRDALTDKLTELPNRRALVRDLDRACLSDRPHTLVFFDLDGFKDYNDAFGHPAGDALLGRLAPALGGRRRPRLPARRRRVLPPARRGAGQRPRTRPGRRRGAQRAGRRLCHRRLARARGPARRRAGRDRGAAPRRRAHVRPQAAPPRRQPRPGARSAGQGDRRARARPRRALQRRRRARAPRSGAASASTPRTSMSLIRAAELHDVGKVAVPDSILRKPGPLDASEWEIMRQHTIAGERILGRDRVHASRRPAGPLLP